MVDVKVPDNWATADEIQKLKQLFEVEEEADYEDALQRICIAALHEYKEMLLGQGVPTRAEDVKQHRLLFLTKYYFKGGMPSEAQVGNMFQLTESQSRALIRNVSSRFRYTLEEELLDTLQSTLKKASLDKDSDDYHLVILSDNVLDEMRRILKKDFPLLKPIAKVPNTSRQFSISVDSYKALEQHLGLDNAKQ